MLSRKFITLNSYCKEEERLKINDPIFLLRQQTGKEHTRPPRQEKYDHETMSFRVNVHERKSTEMLVSVIRRQQNRMHAHSQASQHRVTNVQMTDRALLLSTRTFRTTLGRLLVVVTEVQHMHILWASNSAAKHTDGSDKRHVPARPSGTSEAAKALRRG